MRVGVLERPYGTVFVSCFRGLWGGFCIMDTNGRWIMGGRRASCCCWLLPPPTLVIRGFNKGEHASLAPTTAAYAVTGGSSNGLSISSRIWYATNCSGFFASEPEVDEFADTELLDTV